MKPPHDRVLLADEPQGPVLHVRRMARRKPHSRRLVRDPLQEIAKPLPVLPPGIHRLPEQRHIPRAGVDQPPDLLDHILHRPARHSTSHRWHHTVTTLVITTGHYRY